MKKIFSLIGLAVIAAAVMTSCSKSSSEEPFPTHLCGAWSAYSGSTGAEGVLIIKDNQGGQWGIFVGKPSASGATDTIVGTFDYDAGNGFGTLKTKSEVGSSTIEVQAARGTDHTLSIVWSKVTSGVESSNMAGTRMTEIDFPTKGMWTNQGLDINVMSNDTTWNYYTATLNIPALPTPGPLSPAVGTLVFTDTHAAQQVFASGAFTSFGVSIDEVATVDTLAMEAPVDWNQEAPATETETYYFDVNYISQFYMDDEGYVYGLFTLKQRTDENAESFPMLIKTNASFSQLEYEYDDSRYLLNSTEIRPHPQDAVAKDSVATEEVAEWSFTEDGVAY